MECGHSAVDLTGAVNGKRSRGMARKIGIGNQDFERVRTRDLFYIDKTQFIKEWWESEDSVTLFTFLVLGVLEKR